MRRTTLALLLLATPAAAQDRPQLTPTRDVAVTYRMIGANAPPAPPPGAPGGGITMSWG